MCELMDMVCITVIYVSKSDINETKKLMRVAGVLRTRRWLPVGNSRRCDAGEKSFGEGIAGQE